MTVSLPRFFMSVATVMTCAGTVCYECRECMYVRMASGIPRSFRHNIIICLSHHHSLFITLRLFVHHIILLSSFHYPAALMTVFPVASVAHVQPEHAVLSPALNQQLVERQVVAYVGSHFHGS